MKTYLVGGAIRDQLLGLPVQERDYVVVGATPQEMIAKGFKLVGKDFPVFLHPETHDEYALARTERKTGRGYTGFSCYAAPDVTLEDDLKRRDLTINAIAQTVDGQIIDPYRGQQDLAQKILRHVSPAFSEDPVRILRVARFAARFAPHGFQIAPETLLLMQHMVRSGEVDSLVAERVWQELLRALAEPAPQEFIRVLRQCGALKTLFPEIDQLFGVPNPPKWHPEIDTGIHTLLVLQQAVRLSTENIVRFAALMHDLGKGTTPMTDWPSHPGHEERGVELIRAVCKRYRVPRDYQQLAILVSRYHGSIHSLSEMKASTLVKLLEKLDAFRRPQRFQHFLLACEADARGRPTFEDRDYPQRKFMERIFAAANQVDTQPLLDRGLTGLALGNALHQARIAAVKAIT
jgi:tRNA nucleotidyltransferase (CCA-adding enzyme)